MLFNCLYLIQSLDLKYIRVFFLRNWLGFYNQDMLILRHAVHVFICTYVLKLTDYLFTK